MHLLTDSVWKEKAYRYLPLVFVLALVGLYNVRLLGTSEMAVAGDGAYLFYPNTYLLAQALKEGTLPFWSSEFQCGFPLLADGQPGFLYLPNLLAFGLLPPTAAYNLLMVGHQWLGVLFAFLWGRTLKLSWQGAAWVGLIFALATHMAGNNFPMQETLAWAPLFLALTERLVQARSACASWPIAVCVALQWLAGFPQFAFYSLVAAFVYLAVRVIALNVNWRRRAGLLVAWGSIVAIGLVLAMPQLLPTLELSRYSVRAGGIAGSMSGEGSLFPGALLTFLLPSWGSFFSAAGLGGGGYVGVLSLVLAVLAFVYRKQFKWFPALSTMMIVVSVLALGRYSPLFWLLKRLPGFSAFRIPSRFLVFLQLGLAALAGQGWDLVFFHNLPGLARWIKRGFVAVLGVFVLNSTIGYWLVELLRPFLFNMMQAAAQRLLSDPYHVQPWSYFEAKINHLYESMQYATLWKSPQVMVPGLVLFAAALIWFLTTRKHSRLAGLAWLWAALAAVDLMSGLGWIRGALPSAAVNDPPPAVEAVQLDAGIDLYRVYWVVDERSAAGFDISDLGLLPANYQALFGLSSTGVYSPLGVYDYYRLIEKLGTVNLAFGLRPVTNEDVQGARPLLNLLNVRYVLSRVPLDEFTLLDSNSKVMIYKNEQALSRAFLVDQVQVVPSDRDPVQWILDSQLDLGTTAVLEHPLPVTLRSGASQSASLQVSRYTAHQVWIDVSTPDAVVLVLTDTWYPGWRAWLDDQSTVIYRAYGTFRAVLVPSGEHRVTFTYYPGTFWTGSIAAILGLLALGLWVLVAKRWLSTDSRTELSH